ncbi:MAG: hypothetical protein IPP38_01980 [Bacteroidetes bacterium]|nr:hypothetical protein [Bacteroidota bacterium]
MSHGFPVSISSTLLLYKWYSYGKHIRWCQPSHIPEYNGTTATAQALLEDKCIMSRCDDSGGGNQSVTIQSWAIDISNFIHPDTVEEMLVH